MPTVDDTDACLNSCEAARCGDGITQVGVESVTMAIPTDRRLLEQLSGGRMRRWVCEDVGGDDGNTVLEVCIDTASTAVCDAE